MAEERFKARFDGATAFAALPPDVQAAIGGVAVELVYSSFGVARAEESDLPAARRAFDAAGTLLVDRLHDVVDEALNLAAATDRPMTLPSLLGPVCRHCGCSQEDACDDDHGDGCHWLFPDLCSACIDRGNAT